MSTTNIDQRTFRDAMGSFTTGVCVLGAVREDGRSIGVTVNSFTSVSLNPPLLLVCLGSDSPRSRTLIDAGAFSVSILANDQRDMSAHFAKPGEGLVPDQGWRTGANGAPVLDGSCATMECDIESLHDAGDHVVVIGRLTAIDTDAGREPLVYFRGGYRLIADEDD